ncbi:hypothetical protein [Rhizobium tubonense]|uniref:PhnA-like protein n=1 Tax=Rhizobium tubonense TaxID=484088 RepID=A0A2W4CZN2_9HYPH|nr:hypothetical protein [Rhizobium tubonense]PZM10724.1 hypothetical protein CPY51_22020 [Rhizobium tubonense]
MTVFSSNSEVSAGPESSVSAVSWGAIIAGGVVAAAVTLLLTLLGTGLGLTMISPWSSQSASVMTLSVTTAIWIVIVQWLSAGLGGYMTGRLRTKWVAVHTDEVYFRDTAHGLLTWALATVLLAGVLGSALTSMIGTGIQAASTVTSGAAAAGVTKAVDGASGSSSYFVDSLLRPADPRKPAAGQQPGSDDNASAQIATILANSAVAGSVSPDDQSYLVQLVAAKTGLSEADAKARVDAILKKADDAKVKAQQAADAARKTGAKIALFGTLSLLIGAFIASVAAVLGGRERDDMKTF